MINNNSQQNQPVEDIPVLLPLSEMMTVELVLGKNGTVSILHDKKLPYILKWVEYDGRTNNLTLVSQDGQIQSIGVEIPEGFRKTLTMIKNISAMRVGKSGIEDMYLVPLLGGNT